MVVVSAFWGREVSNGHHPSDGTHVKDLKNLIQVQPPGGDRLFIFLCIEIARGRIPFNPLGDLLLNICYDPAVESILSSGSKYMSLVKPTLRIDLSHHTRADRARPVSFHLSLGRALGRRRRKTTQARHDPVHSSPSPTSCV